MSNSKGGRQKQKTPPGSSTASDDGSSMHEASPPRDEKPSSTTATTTPRSQQSASSQLQLTKASSSSSPSPSNAVAVLGPTGIPGLSSSSSNSSSSSSNSSSSSLNHHRGPGGSRNDHYDDRYGRFDDELMMRMMMRMPGMMYGSPYGLAYGGSSSSSNESAEDKSRALLLDTPVPPKTILMATNAQRLEEMRGNIKVEFALLKELMGSLQPSPADMPRSKLATLVAAVSHNLTPTEEFDDAFMLVCAVVDTRGTVEVEDMETTIASVLDVAKKYRNAIPMQVRQKANVIKMQLKSLSSGIKGGFIKDMVQSVTTVASSIKSSLK